MRAGWRSGRSRVASSLEDLVSSVSGEESSHRVEACESPLSSWRSRSQRRSMRARRAAAMGARVLHQQSASQDLGRRSSRSHRRNGSRASRSLRTYVRDDNQALINQLVTSDGQESRTERDDAATGASLGLFRIPSTEAAHQQVPAAWSATAKPGNRHPGTAARQGASVGQSRNAVRDDTGGGSAADFLSVESSQEFAW